ncbi:MAG: ISL3 family transposase [Acidimicrobiia bacterium]
MRSGRLWQRLLGVERTVVERVDFDEDADAVVVAVRPRKGARQRCGRCGRRCPGYDRGEGRRRWRGLDLGTIRTFLEADAPRVNCPEHGPTVVQVPWARHGAGHTRAFDDQVAWLAVHTSKTAVTELMRVAWRTVGAIITRVVAEARAARDPFDGLRRIGIDEISYKKGHRYLMVVVDHDSGRLVWAAPGHDKRTLAGFFDLLGEDRCTAATLCTDPFHVVSWATDALDEVRRQVWNDARRAGATDHAQDLKGARYALWKNPERLTDRQRRKLAWVATLNGPLYRAYLLKEELRLVFQLRGDAALEMLKGWLAWACRCRIPAFVKLGQRIRKNLPGIRAALTHGLSNALVESTNTKLRLLTRMAFGFKSPEALAALALLDRGGYCPPLPRRGG